MDGRKEGREKGNIAGVETRGRRVGRELGGAGCEQYTHAFS